MHMMARFDVKLSGRDERKCTEGLASSHRFIVAKDATGESESRVKEGAFE